MMHSATTRYDALVAGAGPTGLAMAVTLAHACGGDVRIALVDPGGMDEVATGGDGGDPRAWALSAASVRLLRRLGVWCEVAGHAQAVTAIEITDSSLDAGIRPVLLRYDNRAGEDEPGAYIVPNGVLVAALDGAVESRRGGCITRVRGVAVEDVAAEGACATARLSDGADLHCDIVIAADGYGSALREKAGIKTIAWRYDQLGIVATVTHERAHEGKAVQHFLPGGPFAILPLVGNRSCITWSENADEARRILALDDDGFLAELQQRFGGKLGEVSLDGGRASFPLGMQLARAFVAPRLALVGDAAHTVHPIAGQGLNLALRDVAALSECLRDGMMAGLSFGDGAMLERYQRWRRFDSALSAGAFDALNRLFSNDVALVRSAREVGLGLVDRVPALKQMFVDEGSGVAGQVPELMQ